MRIALIALGSYLFGCVVAAYYLVRFRAGADVRALGSGTAGARNVLRTRGPREAAATLAIDALKGAAAVLLGARLGQHEAAAGVAFLGVIVGHIWPVQLRFHGGKGAAPTLGAMVAMNPVATGLAALVLLAVFAATRNATAAGLTGIGAAPLAYAAIGGSAANVALVAAACALVLLMHHPAFARRVETRGDQAL
jgi:acyl phosphate:glycerol-3-phosphate acyltransferase